MKIALEWIREQWPCISSAGLLGFLAGALCMRRIMAPSFCPKCIRQAAWLKELRDEKTPERKAESRLFYRIRRKDKEEPPK